MTIKEYEETLNGVRDDPGYFRRELIKALWDLTRAVKGGLDD